MKGMHDYDEPVIHKGVSGYQRHRYKGAVPMPNAVRRAIYEAQNKGRRALTVRQLRQLRRKSRA